MSSDEEYSSDDEGINIEEKKFLDLCKDGDVESVKALLTEDPSLISSKDVEFGNYFIINIIYHPQNWFHI